MVDHETFTPAECMRIGLSCAAEIVKCTGVPGTLEGLDGMQEANKVFAALL